MPENATTDNATDQPDQLAARVAFLEADLAATKVRTLERIDGVLDHFVRTRDELIASFQGAMNTLQADLRGVATRVDALDGGHDLAAQLDALAARTAAGFTWMLRRAGQPEAEFMEEIEQLAALQAVAHG